MGTLLPPFFIRRGAACIAGSLIIGLGAAPVAQAVSVYVRAGATGSGSGADWTNAYVQLPATLTRGATYYIAAGNYPAYTFNTPDNGTQTVTVLSATTANHGTSTGWQVGYAGQVVIQTQLLISTDYLILDGQSRTSLSSGYGIKLNGASADPAWMVVFAGNHNTLRYVEMVGRGSSGAQDNQDELIRCVSGTPTNNSVVYSYLHDSNNNIATLSGCHNLTLDHDYLARNWSTPQFHGQGIETDGSNNVVISNNVFQDMVGTGFIAGLNSSTNNGWKVYGNVFYYSSGNPYATEGLSPLMVGCADSSSCSNWTFVHNTIVNVQNSGGGTQAIGPVGTGSGTGWVIENNLWYAPGQAIVFGGTGSGGVEDDNSCVGGGCTANWNGAGAHDVVHQAGSNPFVNWTSGSPGDFHLSGESSDWSSGIALLAPYTMDPDGNTRGADGSWDRGAYEYGSGNSSDTQAPTVPTNLTATPISSSQINLSWNASTDNVGIAGYVITMNGFNSYWVTNGTTFGNTGLTPSTSYTYTVAAYDAAGNISAPTAIVSASTPNIANSSPTVTTPAAAVPSPVTGMTTALSVLGADDNGESALTYTWATTGTPPASVAFGANGTNAAKSTTATFTKAGSYSFRVTIQDAGNLTATSSVNVTVNATLTAITVSPNSATVQPAQIQSFGATAKDQFGATINPAPSYTWTVTGGGSINNSGIFTAGGSVGGPFTVSATASGKSGTAQVTVTAAGTPLPPLDVSSLDGRTFLMTDTIDFTYAATGVTFGWDFEPIVAASAQDHAGSLAQTTSAPRFTPQSAGLSPGVYRLTVTVTQGNQSFTAAPVTVTLAPAEMARVKVYPNPWRSDKRRAHPYITFEGLTIGTTIKLFSVSGHKVKALHTNGPTTTWDLTNDSGDRIGSGIYLYLITDTQGSKVKGELAILK